MVREIHHYCSTSVFLSLIKDKEVWLTSLSQSNDLLEGTWMLRHWLEKFDQRDAKQRLKRRGAQIAVERVLRHNVSLGVCFSEESDLLSQWRGYAQDGSGFSVTFDRAKLESFVARYEGGSPLVLSKIAYGYKDPERTNEVLKLLNGAFGADAEKYQEGKEGFGTISLNLTPDKHRQQKEAGESLFTVKNDAFAEEKEWRLFAFDSLESIKAVEFRESRSALSPFLRVKIPVDVICGVTIGPTNRTPISMVEAALKAHEINGWVKPSKASYRNS